MYCNPLLCVQEGCGTPDGRLTYQQCRLLAPVASSVPQVSSRGGSTVGGEHCSRAASRCAVATLALPPPPPCRHPGPVDMSRSCHSLSLTPSARSSTNTWHLALSSAPPQTPNSCHVSWPAGFPIRQPPPKYPGFSSFTAQGLSGGDYPCPFSQVEGKCAHGIDAGPIICSSMPDCRTVVILLNGSGEAGGMVYRACKQHAACGYLLLAGS